MRQREQLQQQDRDGRVRWGVRRRRLWHGRVRDLRVWPVTTIFVAGRRRALMIAPLGAVVL